MSPRTGPESSLTAQASAGSSTTTTTAAGPTSASTAQIHIPTSGTLRLRASSGAGTAPEASRRVQWAEDVVNNEGMGKKSSKVCCIYHKPRAVGESSDESSSDSSDSDSNSDSDDDGAARPAGGRKDGRGRDHGHNPDEPCNHDHHSDHKGKGKGKARKRSPNAYERIPKQNSRQS